MIPFFKKKNISVIRSDIPELSADVQKGLSRSQVLERMHGGWSNGITDSVSLTESEIILRNSITFFNFVFLVLAVFLVIAHSSYKNMTFLVVIICNTVIGCFQEIRAKRAVDHLTLVAAQNVKTIRDGIAVPIRSDLLVRDDIVEFHAGDQICADGIVRLGDLYVNEALITGEADPILKKSGDTLRSGSFVVAGSGRAQLTHVGSDSFAAHLSLEAKADPRAAKSEMMRSLDRLIMVISVILIPLGGLLFYQEFKVLNLGFQSSVESTVAALVGMIPEGLYLLTSVAMAASSFKLTKKKVLVQDMNCIETLARVDVLCVDKTGTITEPAMEVSNLIPLTEQPPERLEQILGAFYHGQTPENATSQAIAELFEQDSDWICTRRLPFTSETKWSGAVFQDQGAFIIGAPEFILKNRYCEIQEQVESWMQQGFRVLLVSEYNSDLRPGELITERLTPLALILLNNRIRPEAKEAFSYFAEQGVSIRVISGDNPATVAEVAQRAGIQNAMHYIDAETLKTDEDYRRAVQDTVVFGRVTPDQKKKLIQALRKEGHTVAMTGDGVNDVLAMKESDCGIAMASGAQAASQVAQIVLMDSDFGGIPQIVGEGRRVINNIQRAATLFLVKNIFSLFLSVISLFTNWPYPIVPLHLSVISVFTIGIPSFFLAMEPNYERVSGTFLRTVLRRAFPGGLTNIFVIMAAQAYMVVFRLQQSEISTVCAAILGIVGLLVLYQTCKPFGLFRKIIWSAMAVCLIFCFTFIGAFLELYTDAAEVKLVMFTLVVMTPTVFFSVQRLFDFGDQIYLNIREKFHFKKH